MSSTSQVAHDSSIAEITAASPSSQKHLPQHASLQQAAREEGPSRIRSPRPTEVYTAAKSELSSKGSPIKVPSHAAGSSPGTSPAKWGRAAGSLSPISTVQNSKSALQHGSTDHMSNSRFLDSEASTSHSSNAEPHNAASAVLAAVHNGISTSPRMLAHIANARGSSALLQPSQPQTAREGSGIDSPNRLRLRTISAPGSSQLHTQLHTIAVQQATLQSQQQMANAGEANSPRMVRSNSRIPANYAQLNLVVSGSAECHHGGLVSPPGSDGSVVSVCSNPGESPGGSHSQAQPSRFRPKPPIAAPSSASNSASSTPHSGGTMGSTVSTFSSAVTSCGGSLQPHPPNSCRKGAKPLSAGAVGMSAVNECSSPHAQVRGNFMFSGDIRGSDSPAPSDLSSSFGLSSSYQRRGRSFVHVQSADPSWANLAGSNLNFRPAPGMLRVKGISPSGADSSTPNSPSGCVRTPSASGAASSNLGRQDSGNFGDLFVVGSSSMMNGVSSPFASKCNVGASGMLGGSGWASGAFHANSSSSSTVGGPMVLTRESSTPTASPLGISSSGAPFQPSPGGAPSGNLNRPSSSRGCDMVRRLIAAVRSRHDSQLQTVLGEYRSSGVAGLNDLCPTTDRTVLHEAVCLGASTMVKMLLDAGSDANIGHPKEGPPLLQAAAVGAMEIVQLLLAYGADIQGVDVQGSTALHHACRSGHVECAHMLIRQGADLKAHTVDGETPLDMASKEVQIALCSAAAAAGTHIAPAALSRQVSSGQHGQAGGSSSFPGTPNSSKEPQHVSMFLSSSSGGGSSVADDTATQAATGTGGAASSSAPFAVSGDYGLQLMLHPGERSTSSPGILRRISSSNGVSSGMRCTSSGGGLLSQVSSAAPSAAATPAAAAPMHSCGTSPLPAPPLSSSSTSQQALFTCNALGPMPSSSSSSSSAQATAACSSLNSPNSVQDPSALAANMRKPSPPAFGMRESSSGGGRSRSGASSGPPSADATAPGDSGMKTPKDTPQDDYNRCRTPPPLLNLPKDYQGRKGRFAQYTQQQRQYSSSGGRQSTSMEDTQRGHREDDQAAVQTQPGLAQLNGSAAHNLQALTVHDSRRQSMDSPGMPVMDDNSVARQVFSSVRSPTGMQMGSTDISFSSFIGNVDIRNNYGSTGLSRHSAPPSSSSSSSSQAQQQHKPPQQPSQQQQQAVPVAAPVFRFGIDPNSTMDRMDAKAAAAAAAAAVALKHKGSAGLDGINPLEHTFRLRSVDHKLQQRASAVQQQQQQHTRQQDPYSSVSSAAVQQEHSKVSAAASSSNGLFQQQQWQPRTSFDRSDTRVPPLLQDQSPTNSPRLGSNSAVTGHSAHDSSSQGSQQQLDRQASVPDALTTSAEAWGISAARMFEHCSDQLTGNIQWKCGDLIGEGAYGKVYMGLNLRSGVMMAVKELQLVGRRGSEEVNAQLRELTQELDFYKKLKHTNIVGYIDASFKTATNTLYIFLEYVSGGSIADMLRRFGPIPEDVAAKYTRQLLVGLEYLHGQRIVHRDLKCGNVLVDHAGVVKVADFGASKPFGDPGKTDMMKSLRGSAFWMAPEILRGSGYGRKADIWSLGCTVLEMLTGKHPWPDIDNQWSAMLAITQTDTGPPRPPGISPTLSDFLDQCFKMDPKERSSASDLLQHPWVTPHHGNNARTRASLSEEM